MQRAHLILAVAVLAGAGLAGAFLGTPAAEPIPVTISHGEPARVGRPPDASPITIHVAGAVRSPGLVTVGAGDRVAHAIAAAGGALGVADLSALNLAANVADGDQVMVPVKGEAGDRAGNTDVAEGLVDVNRGTAAELEALPGVGPVLAERIFAYREQHGPFETVEDLLDVPGIGEGKLAALREALILR